MYLITVIISVIMSVFSTVVMSYISMATPIGPWIAPTLVLCASLLFKCMAYNTQQQWVALATIAGSIGGILATAIGFSFPTLYFLEPLLFNQWMGSPLYFITIVSILAFISGLFAFWWVDTYEHALLVEEDLRFPVGQLIYKMITALSSQMRKAYELMTGFIVTLLFCAVQDGYVPFIKKIPSSITLFSRAHIWWMNIPAIQLDLFPLVWAIGFVTGHVIAFPLLVGALFRIILVEPLNTLNHFSHLSTSEFTLAFCSGMVLSSALSSFIYFPLYVWKSRYKIPFFFYSRPQFHRLSGIPMHMILKLICPVLLFWCFFSYFDFSFFGQLYVLTGMFICTYQIVVIAGKIGLALLGRYATFVMVPGMIFFGFDSLQVVLLSTFIELCGGIATDMLCSRKIASLLSIDKRMVKQFQYLGLVVSSLAVGITVWFLINYFTLGSAQLFAQKAQARQLLIQARQFDPCVLLIGAVFGFLLHKIKINSALVFGGLLMPLNLVLGLFLGGLCAFFAGKSKEEGYPLWSGVFASNSLWMVFKAMLQK